jgi:RNA polymerase sigma-70 factor (ECF subfamily)
MEVGQRVPAADPLREAKAGDAGAFEALLAPVLDTAFRLAITMLNDRAAAEDAVQEAALRAWRKLGQLRPGADPRPWFLTIVANECRSTRRSGWWRVVRSGEALPGPLPDPSYGAVTDRVDLDAALDRLPKQHLLALTLYYHLDLPIDEVARVLGCSRGAARVRIHRALRALRPGFVMEGDA